jgi:hypothetical protein
VRDYRGGLADWVASGSLLERVAEVTTTDSSALPPKPQLTVSIDGLAGEGPARILERRRWNDSIPGLIDRLSTVQLLLVWIGTVLLCGFGYWVGALAGEHGLVEGNLPLGTSIHGLASALYFSFVTATSVGYGDVLPVGFARLIAIVEAVTTLLIFGAVIAKFVSHRQDQLVGEIHRVTFDERLDRVQSNLHVVISELLELSAQCETPTVPVHRLATRLHSTVWLFLSELRTTHDLLYQPRLMVEEIVLASILGNLASALEVLAELMNCLPADFTRTDRLEIALGSLTRTAEDICGNCVPHEYTPRLIFWMDRIQETARRIH